MIRLLLLACLVAAPAGAQIPDALAGRWSGAAVYTGGALRLLDLDVSVVAADSLGTVLTQPYNGFTRFAVGFEYAPGRADGELTAELFGDEMRLVVDLTDGTLRGTVVTDGDTTATVSLARVLAYPLPTLRIDDLTFRAGPDTLAGSLVLPSGAGPHPVALLVPGRGFGYARTEMADWATLLARNGVGAFVYDARGTGGSTGNDSLTTGDDRVADVRAALDLLSSHPDVRGDALGILSNSAGAWVVPLAIEGRSDVSFWVSLVGPVGTLAGQQSAAVRRLMQDSGTLFTDAEVAAAVAYQERLVQLSLDGAPWAAFAPVVADASTQRWAEFADLPDSLTDEQLAYYRRRARFDNAAAMRRLRVPMLAVYGTADWVVPPEVHVPALRAAAAEAGNDALTVLVLPGAEHSLGVPGGRVGEGAWPGGYERVWGRSGVLFTTVAGWVRAQVGLD